MAAARSQLAGQCVGLAIDPDPGETVHTVPEPRDRPHRVFVGYAPEDQALADELLRHLAVLQQLGGVDPWSADWIQGSGKLQSEVDEALERADIALLLLSADFLASDFLQNVLLPKLLDKHAQLGLRVVPILLRSCLWEVNPWLDHQQLLPKDRRPIASLQGEERDRILTELAGEVAHLALSSTDSSPRMDRESALAAHKTAQGAEELLIRYAAGEREFAGADLNGSQLDDARLRGALLSGSRLRGARLNYADLRGASLRGADLRGADLSGADLTKVELTDANLGGAILGATHLIGIDLSSLCDAKPPVKHEVASHVDYDSISKSLHSPYIKEFLQRAGMPEVIVEYMVECAKAARGYTVKDLASVFISYAGPDEAFARKLHEALHRNGVTTFFFPEHATSGMKLHRTMRQGINEHDRVVVICSKESLDRPAVLFEIQETVAREERDDGSYLIPVTLDDYMFSTWKPPNKVLAEALRGRVVADFRGGDKDAVKFGVGLRRLVAALRR